MYVEERDPLEARVLASTIAHCEQEAIYNSLRTSNKTETSGASAADYGDYGVWLDR